MKYLLVKMRRDLLKMWTQFFSVFCMAFLGILIYVGTEGTWYGMKTEIDRYFTQTNLASAWTYGSGITNSDIDRVKQISGVTDCSLAMTLTANVIFSGSTGDKTPDLLLISSPSNNISAPITISGEKYSPDTSGIFIESEFAKANNIKSNDVISVKVGDVTKSLVIKGLVMSAEYMYYTGSSTDSMPNHKQHGYAFIGSASAKELFNETVALKLQETMVSKLKNNIDKAYSDAKGVADKEAENLFSQNVASRKSIAYKAAVAYADNAIEKAFYKELNDRKQQYYTNAKAQADAEAQQAVDKNFSLLYPNVTDFRSLPQYKTVLSEKQADAEEKAKSAVDAQFAANSTKTAQKLADAKAAAEQKAVSSVDANFLSMNMSDLLAAAKTQAESKAETIATQKILDNLKISDDQLNVINQMTALPKINTLGSNKADVSEKLIELTKKLPDSILSQKVNGFSLSVLKSAPVCYNIMRIRYKEGTDSLTVEQKVQEVLGTKYAGYTDRDSLSSVSTVVQKTKQIEKMSIMFSLIFILLALLTMQTTMARLVDTQKIQIGTMKALGLTNRQIRFHYISYGLTVGLIGGLLGLVVAPFTISPALLYSQSSVYSLPVWPVELTPASYIMVVVVALCCTAATLIACRKGLVGMPAETMRGMAPAKTRNVFLEKLPRLWNKINFAWKWTIRDIARNKVRSVIGIIGVLGCMMLLMAGFGMQYTDGKVPTYVYDDQYSYTSKVVISSNATDDNRSELLRLAGGGQWVQETAAEYKNSPDNSGGILSIVDNGNYIHLKNSEGVDLKPPESGVIVTQRTARILNLKKGSTVEFKLPSEKEYVKASVADIAVTPSPQGIFISKSAYLKLGKTFTPTSLLIGTTNENQKISSLSYITDVATRSNQKISSENNLKTFYFIFMLLKGAAILLDIIILYNLGVLTFTERTREYATLKVLGFYQREIRSFALRENLATAIVGWLIGIPVGFKFLEMYVGAVSSASLDMTPQLSVFDFILATLITVGCSVCVNLFLSHRVKKINMVEALKSVE